MNKEIFKQLVSISLKKTIYFHIYLILLLPFFLSASDSISVQYLAEFIGNEKGLNSSEISTLYQDKDGFIWVGNKPGVSRFDGYEFKNFTKADTSYLGQIYAIEEDAKGTIWVGGANGLFFYRDGIFHISKLAGYAIRDLHLDQENRLWVGGFDFIPFALTVEELSALQLGEEVNAQPIVSREEWRKKIGSLHVWAIDTDVNNHLWLGLEKCKASFDGQQLQVHWKDTTTNHKYSVVAAFHQDSIFWGCEEAYTFFQKNGQFETPAEISNLTYEIVVTDTASYFLTASHIVKLQDGKWQNLFAFNDKIDFYFQNMLMDREGNFWIGGDGNLLKLTPTYFTKMTEADYPLLEYNFNIAEWSHEAILISGAAGKIKKIEQQEVEFYDFLNVPNTSEVRAIFIDDNDWMWYGTSMSGIVLKRNGVEENYNVEEGLGNKVQYFFYQTKDSQLWSGGAGSISRINVDPNGQIEFDNFKTASTSLDLPFFQYLFESPSGILWSISDKGLFQLKDGQLVQWLFPSPYNSRPILTGAKVDQYEQLWLSTQGEGLWQCHFNEEGEPELIRQWTTQDGLLTDVILNVHIDKRNRVWSISQAGVCQIDGLDEQPSIHCFDKTDGWSNAPTARYKLLERNNGELWSVGSEAINIFPLYNLPKNKVQPQCFITDVQLLDEKEDIFQYSKNEKASNQLPQQLILPYDKNALRFYFTTTSHTKPEKNKFKYQLIGIDKDWYIADQNRSVFYPSLPSGKYTFNVLAANNDGLWGTEATTFSFKIMPPWWATWWAYLFYTAIISGILALFYRFQLSRKLAVEKSQRLQEINQFKSNLYTNITHEFRTPLTVILGIAENLQTQSIEQNWQYATQSLQMIGRNSNHLLQLVNEMLDLAKLESGHLELQLQQTDIIPFVKYLSKSFHSLAAEKNITLVVDTARESLTMDFDATKLESIISNLLSNAIKFTSEGGKVKVDISSSFLGEQSYFSFKVKDSGRGISTTEIPHIFDRFYQVESFSTRTQEGTGIGLALTKELVELMGGVIEVESELEKGSEFVVKLPITKTASLVDSPMVLAASHKSSVASMMHSPKSATTEKNNLPLVLIIEDNQDVAHYISTCLEGKYQYLYAANGKIGIEMALEQIPDIIISDVMMPEKDGFEVCITLKTDERTNHIPIIMLTAKATVQDRLKGLSHGADAYLAKPFEKEELWIRLHHLLELRKTLQQKYSQQLLEESQEKKNNLQEDPFVAKAKAIVLAQLENENFSHHELSLQLFLSSSQVYRKLKAVTGMSISIFIRHIRLQEAKKLLLSSNLTITEIAYKTGFKTPLYFSQIFKETFNESPSSLRK